MDTVAGTARHWDDAYRQGDRTRSWYQSAAEQSLRMLDSCDVHPDESVVDVGGGASVLVDALLERGHADVTVVDISAVGLDTARRRLGSAAERVQWVVADVLEWKPERTWHVWHDRAVFHFLTTETARAQYLRALDASTGAVCILATFAPDGPSHCSGLPVERYGADDLATMLGPDWQLITDASEQHVTPAGVIQPFTWAGFRRVQ